MARIGCAPCAQRRDGLDDTQKPTSAGQSSATQKTLTVGQLTRGVAHEFNNQLQGIVGAMELVRKLVSLNRAAETEKFIVSALSSAQRAAGIVQSLLNFARERPYEPRPLDVNELLKSMENLLRGSQSSATKVQLAPTPAVWTTVCDANRLEHAVLDIVIKARDAMPEGGTIVIETMNHDRIADDAQRAQDIPPGQYVCIAVTSPAGGATHDLALPAAIADECHGHVRMRSEAQRGTTVTLYLPRQI